MSKRTVPKPPGRRRAPPSLDDPPLIRVLLAESGRRGDTLEHLARELGVPYQRIAEWRRLETSISNAKRSVLRAAARYLGMPTAFVLCLSGVISVEDFVRPAEVAMPERLRRAMERVRVDPLWAGFFPDALMTADQEVQRFVALLYEELRGPSEGSDVREFEWMRAIHRAAIGDAQAQAELASYGRDRPDGELF